MITPPIIIDARGDLLVFASQAQAERELRAEDVRAGAYPVAYDRTGRLLRIEARLIERRVLGLFRKVEDTVRITPYEHIPTHDEALQALLARFVHPKSAAPALVSG